MRNVVAIAVREFVATVATRAFIIGLLLVPAMIGVFALVGPRLFNPRNVQIAGDVMVIDPTGRVTAALERAFDPVRVAARRAETTRRALASAPETVRRLNDGGVAEGVIRDALGPVPDIRVVPAGGRRTLDEGKDWVVDESSDRARLALVVIHPDAVDPTGEPPRYGSYDLYEARRLDDVAGAEIRSGLREAIVDARLEASALDATTVEAMVRVTPGSSVTVTADEERESVRGFNILLPAAFGVLLMMGVMGGGGQLLTTMVEEKSSRVVEVLLSAVSPMELMAGKLLGQMAVSLIGMSVYLGIGLTALASFALLGLLDVRLIVYLLLFFVITYLVMGSLMMAVGSAVNDMREAQGLLMPLMMAFMIPWLLWFPITRNPDSWLSLVVSFVPPLNTFGMLLRLASTSPPPAWQVWLSVVIGIGSVFAAIWFTAKIFRVGLLMYGKPPDIRTLVRWVRSA